MGQCMTAHNIEELGFGNQRYWVDDGQIVVIYGGGNMSRDSLDIWADAMMSAITHFPGDTIYLVLDISHPNQGFTPYARAKAEAIYATIGQRTIYGAIVLRNSIIAPIITAFIRHFPRRRLNIYQQVFTDKEAAFDWLRQQRQRKLS